MLSKSPYTVGVLAGLVLGKRTYQALSGRVEEYIRTVSLLQGAPGQGKTSWVRSFPKWLLFEQEQPDGTKVEKQARVVIESGPKLARPIHDVVTQGDLTFIKPLKTEGQAIATALAKQGEPVILGIDELRAIPPGHGISQLLELLAGDPEYTTVRVIAMTNEARHYDTPDPIANRANVRQRFGEPIPFEEMSQEPFIKELVRAIKNGAELPVVKIPDTVNIDPNVELVVDGVFKAIGSSEKIVDQDIVSNRTKEWVTVNLTAADAICSSLGMNGIFAPESTDILRATVAIRFGPAFGLAFAQQIGQSYFPLEEFLFATPETATAMVTDPKWGNPLTAFLVHSQAKHIARGTRENEIETTAREVIQKVKLLEEIIANTRANNKVLSFIQNLNRALTQIIMVEPRFIKAIWKDPEGMKLLKKYYYSRKEEGDDNGNT